MYKAQNVAGLGLWQGFARQCMAFLAPTRRQCRVQTAAQGIALLGNAARLTVVICVQGRRLDG